MAHLRRFFRSGSLLVSLGALAGSAVAGSPDPNTLREQLEEQVLEGDMDTEDIAVLRSPRAHERSRRGGQTYVGLSAFAGDRRDGRREYGGLIVLQVSFEHFVRSSARTVAAGEAAAQLDRAGFDPSARSAALLPTGIHEPAGERVDRAPSPGPVVVTTDVARACVRAAWRMLSIADDANIDSMGTRARASAALPELRLRAMRSLDESGRVTLSDTDPYRYTESGAATNWLEARLTFRLDRLLFADDELSLERIRIERSELRSRTAAKVLQALFEWQRAYALVQEPSASTAEHFAAVLRELEASAILDVMTDGWFGRFRASLDPRVR
jgi:hypothetical protein